MPPIGGVALPKPPLFRYRHQVAIAGAEVIKDDAGTLYDFLLASPVCSRETYVISWMMIISFLRTQCHTAFRWH